MASQTLERSLAHLVDLDICVRALIIDEANADGALALLALEHHSVALEELEFLHLLRGKANHRVVVVGGLPRVESSGESD